jgi:hypothetical protein
MLGSNSPSFADASGLTENVIVTIRQSAIGLSPAQIIVPTTLAAADEPPSVGFDSDLQCGE